MKSLNHHLLIFVVTIICSVDIQIDGTIVAPDEPKNWSPKFARTWLDFSKLEGVLFQGQGVIDGSGSNWWAASCKKNKTNVSTFPLVTIIDSMMNELII